MQKITQITLFLTFTILSISAKQIPELTQAEIIKLPSDGGTKFNRLIFEKSPYLLQHATNPVDWHPWSEQTLKLAEKNQKPIFISIGYSSCHWCHVMNRESFDNADIAKLLNNYFIPVKIDREERPDIDRIYMAATQLIRQGRGGWPNNLWLTPSGLPFYAGTYFSTTQFEDLLLQLSKKWSDNKQEVLTSAKYMNTLLQQMLNLEPREAININQNYVNKMLKRMENRLNSLNSIKTSGPKFPPHQILHFITNQALKQSSSKIKLKSTIESALQLLKTLAKSGLYDHLAGGFHRYSTDGNWFLPHYEKMLYDNTQLAQAYAAAYAISKESFYKTIALEIFEFLEREMITTEGLYASAIDAESEDKEGLFYFWTTTQLQSALSRDEYLNFIKRYKIKENGNFTPENGSSNPGFNLLSKSTYQNWNNDKLVRQKLLQHRNKRIWPLIDNKVLCDWNALAIESLAKASKWLDNKTFLSRAKRIADKLTELLWVKNKLYHHGRNGQHGKVLAYLSDYAYLSRALITLSKSSGDPTYLSKAQELLHIAWNQFFDEDSKNLFNSSVEHKDLIFRVLDLDDNVLPAAPAVFLEANIESKNSDLKSKALALIPYYMNQLIDSPASSVSYLTLLITQLQKNTKISAKKTPSVKKYNTVKIEKHPLSIEAKSSKTIINLKIKIKDGFHVNSAEPYQDYLIPTKIEILNKNQITYEKITYPDGKDYELDFSDEELSVYEGTLHFKIKYKIKDPATTKIYLKLSTQACSDSECLPPQVHEITLEI